MKKDEMEILWAVSSKLDDDTLFYVTYQYHTEKDPSDYEGKKNDRSKSRYRMIGRVERIADVENTIRDSHDPANRMKPWKWPDDPSWDGSILYSKDASNEGLSNWLRNKIRKAIPFADAVKAISGYKKDTKKSSPTFGQYVILKRNAVRDVKEYSCTDGSVIDIDDPAVLKTKIGQTFYKEIQMKLVGPKGA